MMGPCGVCGMATADLELHTAAMHLEVAERAFRNVEEFTVNAQLAAEKHQPEDAGCSCGFCAWSVEHVLIMSIREAWDARCKTCGAPCTEARCGCGPDCMF